MKFIKYAYQFNRAKVIPTHLEKKYVHHTYNLIAQHFDHTRFAVWPRVKEFIDALEEGSLIYDIGCGNGKYFHDSNKFMLGTDVSPNLLDYALKRNEGAMLMASDILKLPIRT
jgi:SAM-dependent methyltransferase